MDHQMSNLTKMSLGINKKIDLPKLVSYEEQAIDTVVAVLNRAKEKLGVRLTLRELAHSRDVFTSKIKVSLSGLGYPLTITSEKFIADTIEKKWRLTDKFKYILRSLGLSQDECSQYYYFEAIFSQPTAAYPIPQATTTVFFRIEDKLLDPPETKRVPIMTFRIEGQRMNHDVRSVTLTEDWILAVIMMKIKLYKRIEKLRLF